MMTRMSNLILTLTLSLAAAAPASTQDVIKFTDPKRPDAEGEVLSLTFKLVDFELITGGQRIPQKAQAKEIREITLDTNRKTYDFASGEDLMGKGDFAAAAERFERAKRDPRANDAVKQMSAIKLAQCHYQAGDLKSALAAIKALRQEKAESFYLRESYELEYKCHLQEANVGGLAQAVAAFEEKGRSEGMQEWAKSAEVMRGQLFEFQSKWSEALAIHRKYANDRDVGEEATLGEIRCLQQLGQWAPLKAKADVVLSSHKGKKGVDRLLTAAFNARGEIALNGGKPMDALLEFMQGVAVLNKSGDTTREHEAAIARAGVACARVAAAEKDKGKKDTYKRRAQELLGDLEKIYPGSPLRAQVQQAIQDVK